LTIDIAIVGAGPAGLTLACALAQEGGYSIHLFERDQDHFEIATYNPSRSYTIDITGHGLNAARRIDITDRFDNELIGFKGIKMAPAAWLYRIGVGYSVAPYKGQGWTGSRGDICRSLQAHLIHRHGDAAHLHFGVEAQLVDARHAELHLSWLGSSRSETHRFDLVVGCDGGGSGVRRALAEGPADFSVESMDLGNQAMMLHFDQHLEELDPHYLYVLAIRPVLAVAGAINGPNGPTDPRWFCQIGFPGPMQFPSFEEAAELFDRIHPLLRHLASDAMVAAFSQRESLPTGKSKRCSSLVVDRVALLGDAGAPVPPVGQGVNAAMQGATVLAQCLAEHRGSLDEGLAMYARQWQGECDALRQIAIATYQSQTNSPWRILLASKFGHLGIQLAKDEKLSYREAWEQSQARNERPN
jgi:2-polyprenyl-6-methoxyphenol hydroxylase-like FAD-dependent oxidoreductase